MNINLASEPFRRDRPMVAASIAVAVLMAGVLGMLLYLISAVSYEGAETAQAIQQTQAELRELTAAESKLQNELLRPENEIVLDRSIFLNALLVRKGVSWTLLFADLEEVLPYNVKLVQVRPQVSVDNQVQLEMVVASQTAEPVITMLKAIEGSELFSSMAVSATLPPTETEPLYRYRVSVNYEREL
jgi:type IV pilus assembly protein PilN